MKERLIRCLNPVDTEIGGMIHGWSLGYGGFLVLTLSLQKDLEAQTWSTVHIHMISTLASIKSKYKIWRFASYLAHKYIWILHVLAYLILKDE